MAFFEKLSKTIGDAAGATAAKAKELAEITKLNSNISAEEKQIERVYSEIGKIMFEHDKLNSDSPAFELCSQILESQKTIDELRQKIQEIKEREDDDKQIIEIKKDFETMICPACSASVSTDTKFCGKCGALVIQQEEPKGKVCSVCGAQSAEDINFCGKCGSKIE